MNNAEDHKTQIIIGNARGLNRAEYDEWCKFAEYALAQYDVACYPYEDCCRDEFLGDEPEQASARLEATWKRWLP